MASFGEGCSSPRAQQVASLQSLIVDRGNEREAAGSGRPQLTAAELFGADFVAGDGQGFELWLGSLEDALCLQNLRHDGITGILNCALRECEGECAVFKHRGSRRRTHARGLSLLAEGFEPSNPSPKEGEEGEDEDELAAPMTREQIRAVAQFDSEWYSDMLGQHIAYLGFAAEDRDGYAIDAHFEEIFEFLRRCQAEQRKVLVHCVMGINRSTTALVAYLCQELGMDLTDAVEAAARRHGHVLSNASFLRRLVEAYGGAAPAHAPACRGRAQTAPAQGCLLQATAAA